MDTYMINVRDSGMWVRMLGMRCLRRCWHPIHGLIIFCVSLLLISASIQRYMTIHYMGGNVSMGQGVYGQDNDATMTSQQVQAQRVGHLRHTCHQYGLNTDLDITKLWKSFFFVDQRHKLVYCGIPKVGCTFMKRLLHVLGGKAKTNNPYDISANAAHSLPLETFAKFSDQNITYFLKNFQKMIIVRDPIKRLLSGYQDKLVAINPMYWKVGANIIKLVRHNPSALSSKCGHDLTFDEFLNYRIYEEITSKGPDMHWDMVYRICHPCMINYNFIGQMETFSTDIDTLLMQINAKQDVNLKANYTVKLDNILIEVHNFYGRKADAMKCGLTFEDLTVRLQDVLVQKGLLSPNFTMPHITENTTKPVLIDILTKTYNDETTSGAIYQKPDELSRTSSATLAKVQELYRLDFDLFGYKDHYSVHKNT